MKERTRWREVVPGVLTTKARSGVKRSRSQSKAKPGQLKRQRKRTRLAKLNSGGGETRDQSCPAPFQLGLGLPGLESGLGALDDGLEEVEVARVPAGVPAGEILSAVIIYFRKGSGLQQVIMKLYSSEISV